MKTYLRETKTISGKVPNTILEIFTETKDWTLSQDKEYWQKSQKAQVRYFELKEVL